MKDFFDGSLLKEVDKHGGRVNDAFNDMSYVFLRQRVLGVELNLTDKAVEDLGTGELLPEELDDLVMENHDSLHVLTEVIGCHFVLLNV